jgi:hypothetical protein
MAKHIEDRKKRILSVLEEVGYREFSIQKMRNDRKIHSELATAFRLSNVFENLGKGFYRRKPGISVRAAALAISEIFDDKMSAAAKRKSVARAKEARDTRILSSVGGSPRNKRDE